MKKTASIVLPIVLAGFGMPVGFAGMFGSGIGTLIQGGNLKDALKASLLSGLTAGVLKGAGAAFKGGTFGEGFRGAFDTGGQGFFGKEGFIEKALAKTPEAVVQEGAGEGVKTIVSDVVEGANPISTGTIDGSTRITDLGMAEPFEVLASDRAVQEAAMKNIDATIAKESLAKGAGGVDVRGPLEVLRTEGQKVFGPEGKFREIFMPKSFYGKEADISFLRRFGPGAAAATGIMAATGGFKVPEQEDPGLFPRDEFGNPITGASMIRQDPGAYLIADIGDLYLDPETGTYKRKGRQDETWCPRCYGHEPRNKDQ